MPMRGIAEHPAGLTYVPDALTVPEEAVLLARFAELETSPVVMRGVASRRRVRHFGVGYDFATWGTTTAEELPPYLLELRRHCRGWAGADPDTFVEALVTCYPPGATIGWHRDASAFGPLVVGVSLGSDCVMRFQRTAAGGERRVYEQPLQRRSTYVLAGAARSAWQHSVPAVPDTRWSVTFRQVRRPAGD